MDSVSGFVCKCPSSCSFPQWWLEAASCLGPWKAIPVASTSSTGPSEPLTSIFQALRQTDEGSRDVPFLSFPYLSSFVSCISLQKPPVVFLTLKLNGLPPLLFLTEGQDQIRGRRYHPLKWRIITAFEIVLLNRWLWRCEGGGGSFT